jgi:hypothetical protein
MTAAIEGTRAIWRVAADRHEVSAQEMLGHEGTALLGHFVRLAVSAYELQSIHDEWLLPSVVLSDSTGALGRAVEP